MSGFVTSACNLVSVPLTCTASSAYTAGNTVDGLKQIGTGLPANATVILTDIVLDVKSTQTGQFDVIFLSAYPGSSAIADKTAVAINAADSAKVQGAVSLSTYVSVGTPTVYTASSLSTALKVDADGNLWMIVVTRGTPTFAATSDVTVNLKFVQ